MSKGTKRITFLLPLLAAIQFPLAAALALDFADSDRVYLETFVGESS